MRRDVLHMIIYLDVVGIYKESRLVHGQRSIVQLKNLAKFFFAEVDPKFHSPVAYFGRGHRISFCGGRNHSPVKISAANFWPSFYGGENHSTVEMSAAKFGRHSPVVKIIPPESSSEFVILP